LAQPQKKTSLILTQDLQEALDHKARSLGITRSEVAREILSQWLDLGSPVDRGYMAGWRAAYRLWSQRVGEIGPQVEAALRDGFAGVALPEEAS
jgi:Ribbon-helix-helix protein, copG family